MTHHNAFLQAICESPDDDAPRLIYADWLDDHGDPDRAEFIRAQCELAALNKDNPPLFLSSKPTNAARIALVGDRLRPARPELANREFALLRKHEAEWSSPVSHWTFWRTFRRGFVEQVTIGVLKFFKHAEELFAASPVRYAKVMHMAATRPVTPVSALVAVPSLSRLAGLDLAKNSVGLETGVRELCASPHLAGLTSLGLSHSDLGAKGVKALSELPALPNLTTLELASNDLGLPGARALAALPLPALAYLDLHNNELEDKGVRALARSPVAVRLRALDLSRNFIGPEGLQALTASPHLQHLVWLGLGGNRIDQRRKEHRALVARFGKAVCMDDY